MEFIVVGGVVVGGVVVGGVVVGGVVIGQAAVEKLWLKLNIPLSKKTHNQTKIKTHS